MVPTALRRSLGAVAVAGTAAVTLAACGGGGGGGSGHSNNGSGSTQSSSSSSSQAHVSGTRVTVTETEYALKLSRSHFTPGTYTFVSDNAGKVTHALSIDGPGVEDAHTSNIQHGQHATLTVTLKKGNYDIYCPVDSHKQLGMDQHITVG
ncbi:copper-binding protein [Streptomyces sp. L2]|uniref:copper-binding protein n=1 Tax=Streptomyces sp. L2 TaxID=2162665 RepID=UPI0010107AB6|nr:copper-binding protein [Streptomyces sp. L2]